MTGSREGGFRFCFWQVVEVVRRTRWRVITAESQHLYTRADYHLIIKTTRVVATIFNDTYDLTSLATALIKGEVTATGAYLNVET